jgi:hypothetical protein
MDFGETTQYQRLDTKGSAGRLLRQRVFRSPERFVEREIVLRQVYSALTFFE